MVGFITGILLAGPYSSAHCKIFTAETFQPSYNGLPLTKMAYVIYRWKPTKMYFLIVLTLSKLDIHAKGYH